MTVEAVDTNTYELNDDRSIVVIDKATVIFKSGHVRNYALDSVSLKIRRGEAVGIVGESGSGKTTLGLAVLKILRLNAGRIFFDGMDISRLRSKKLALFRSKTQMIFQDPYSSLNPYNTIFESVATPVFSNISRLESELQRKVTKREIRSMVSETLEKVGLSPGSAFLDVYPRKLSGGQRQRVAVARALIMHPKLVVADEPTSMLDVSITAQVANLLKSLQKEMDFSLMYISHELSTSRYISNRIAVMCLGRVVELGTSEDITKSPMHPYTDILIRSMPEVSSSGINDSIAKIDFNAYNGGIKGCVFAHSCPRKTEICTSEKPLLQEMGNDHEVACFHPIIA
ncbi:MAG: ABC transporter ATP-binding protein [Candidatus Thermoplasmatota archaeon]|nr:ABC transporter ATP-binding protein [Candidatus Thermoplasmatota archaeon]